jgi:hypothetical protein
MRTQNISEVLLKKPIEKAGFDWRPYVLRRYYDTRMMMAESDGLIINAWRVFWMGHKGDIEAIYTLNKGNFNPDLLEKMREAYAKASHKYLQTIKTEMGEEKIKETFKKQLLAVAGYSEEEISKLDISMTDDELHNLVKQRLLGAISNNGSRQKVVLTNQVGKFLDDGWEYVAPLSNNKAIIRTSAA